MQTYNIKIIVIVLCFLMISLPYGEERIIGLLLPFFILVILSFFFFEKKRVNILSFLTIIVNYLNVFMFFVLKLNFLQRSLLFLNYTLVSFPIPGSKIIIEIYPWIGTKPGTGEVVVGIGISLILSCIIYVVIKKIIYIFSGMPEKLKRLLGRGCGGIPIGIKKEKLIYPGGNIGNEELNKIGKGCGVIPVINKKRGLILGFLGGNIFNPKYPPIKPKKKRPVRDPVREFYRKNVKDYKLRGEEHPKLARTGTANWGNNPKINEKYVKEWYANKPSWPPRKATPQETEDFKRKLTLKKLDSIARLCSLIVGLTIVAFLPVRLVEKFLIWTLNWYTGKFKVQYESYASIGRWQAATIVPVYKLALKMYPKVRIISYIICTLFCIWLWWALVNHPTWFKLLREIVNG